MNRPNDSEYVLTFDVDWAPDWMIEDVVAVLVQHGVKATWFVTHASRATEALQQRRDLFEVGIHPNCLSGSTQGNSEDEVLQHLTGLVPGAVSMRTHALYQSTPFLVKASSYYGISVDTSIYLPRCQNLAPFRITGHGAALWRVPYFWEDDCEMFENHPIWQLSDPRLHGVGLKVFDFHPVFLALNAIDFRVYATLRDERPLPTWTRDFVGPHIHDGCGPHTFFVELVKYMSSGSAGQWIRTLVGE